MPPRKEKKRERTPAQKASDERLRQRWADLRQPVADPVEALVDEPLEAAIQQAEVRSGIRREAPIPTVRPPSSRQSFLARNGRLTPRVTIEDATQFASPEDREHAGAGVITVEHITDEKVKMWKRGPFGWTPRPVPVSTIAANLANGWMEYCPDCGGSECSENPNSCSGKRGRRYIVCPTVDSSGRQCGKTIYATGLPQAEDERIHDLGDDPLEVTGTYTLNPEVELKAKMDIHLMTFHRDEARSLGLFGGATPMARLGMDTDVLLEPQVAP